MPLCDSVPDPRPPCLHLTAFGCSWHVQEMSEAPATKEEGYALCICAFPSRRGGLNSLLRCRAGGDGVRPTLLTQQLCFSLQVVVLLGALSWGRLEDD